MTEKTLNDLFLAQLKDIYFAEKPIYKTLPQNGKGDGHIERLEEVFEMMGKRSQTKPCEAIRGINFEGEEMARYGALIAWAKQLNMPKAAALLNETLREEVKADKLLTQIGATKADKKAA